MRIPIVSAPLADVDVMRTGAVLGQRLLAVTRNDFDVNAGAFGGLLEGLGDALERLHRAHVDGHFETVRITGFGQQLFGALDIEFVRVVSAGTEQAHRQKVLVNRADVLMREQDLKYDQLMQELNANIAIVPDITVKDYVQRVLESIGKDDCSKENARLLNKLVDFISGAIKYNRMLQFSKLKSKSVGAGRKRKTRIVKCKHKHIRITRKMMK